MSTTAGILNRGAYSQLRLDARHLTAYEFVENRKSWLPLQKKLEALGWEEDDECYEEEYEKTEILVENFLAEEDLKSPWDREKEDLGGILDALVKVYDQGVLHRDIKPSNIFMEYAGEEDSIDAYWVLGDFGASKPLGRNKNSGMTLADIRTEPYGPTRTPKEKQHEETWDVFGWGAVAVSLW